jgi:hypothetical protein
MVHPVRWHSPGLPTALAAHQLAEPDDRVQRGAQLMAHVREEVALGLAGGGERGDRLLQAPGQVQLLGQQVATLG